MKSIEFDYLSGAIESSMADDAQTEKRGKVRRDALDLGSKIPKNENQASCRYLTARCSHR